MVHGSYIKYPNIGGYVYCAGNPVKLIDPDGRDPIFNKNGKLLGNDNNNTGRSYVALNFFKALRIRRQLSKGNNVNSSDVYGLPDVTVLKAAIDVYDRITKEGGDREYASLVYKPEFRESNNNQNSARVMEPGDVWNDENIIPTSSINYSNADNYSASIHSHPVTQVGNSVSQADKVGPGDPDVFKDFDCNIIVGAKGINVPAETRPQGMGFYGRSAQANDSPELWLSIDAVKK